MAGGGLLALHYRKNVREALKKVYPEHAWLPWRFVYTPRGFLATRENRVEFFKYAAAMLDIKDTEKDKWYSVRRSQLEDLGGAGILVNYYGHSLRVALKDIYPDHPWEADKFAGRQSPQSTEGIALIVHEFETQHQIKTLDAWYRVPSRDWKGHSLNRIVHRTGSLLQVLKLVYPDHSWNPRLFYVFGKKSMQQKLKMKLQELLPGYDVLEDVHTSSIATWSTNRHLQFDLFVPELYLALEYQGEQHYEDVSPRMKSQAYWKQMDAEKMALCGRNGITLVEIPWHSWDGNAEFIHARLLSARPDLEGILPPVAAVFT